MVHLQIFIFILCALSPLGVVAESESTVEIGADLVSGRRHGRAAAPEAVGACEETRLYVSTVFEAALSVLNRSS